MFKFGIRDLLSLTVIVALGLGWWVDRHAISEQRKDTIKLLYACGDTLDVAAWALQSPGAGGTGPVTDRIRQQREALYDLKRKLANDRYSN